MPRPAKRTRKASKKLTPRQRKALTNMAPRIQLNSCTKKYAALVANPFGSHKGACLPYPPAIHTAKQSFWVKGTLNSQVGGANAGRFWIGMRPKAFRAGDWTTTDLPIFTSDSTTVSGGASTAGANVVFEQSNSNYSTSDFGVAEDKLQFRVMCAGLRVRYRGPQDKKGGRVIGMTHPEHRTLESHNITDLLAYSARARTTDLGNGWHEIRYLPAQSSDFTFSADTAADVPCMTFVGDCSDAAVSYPIDYEAFVHFEMVGEGTPTKTSTHNDQNGADAVMSVQHSVGFENHGSGPAATKNLFAGIDRTIRNGTQVVNDAVQVANTAYQGYNALKGARDFFRGITSNVGNKSPISGPVHFIEDHFGDDIGVVVEEVEEALPMIEYFF